MRAGRTFVASIVFCVLAVACATETPQATPSPDGDGIRTESLPDEPKVDIVWQNTVVDIEPTSRFRDPVGGADTAHVSVTMLLARPAGDELKEFLDGLDNVGVGYSEEGRLVRLSYREEVEQTDEPGGETDRYEYHFVAPVPFAKMDKNDDVSATVLLPRSATRYEGAPQYDVTLESAEDGQEFAAKDEGQRTAVLFYARQDPPWDVIYQIRLP